MSVEVSAHVALHDPEQGRERDCVPPPHVLEHVPQAPQTPQLLGVPTEHPWPTVCTVPTVHVAPEQVPRQVFVPDWLPLPQVVLQEPQVTAPQ
jgi:hypothetical protein